jgi:hypothetical protein
MLGGIQNGQRLRQGQQEIDLQKQQQQRADQQADMDFHQHMVELGAQPIINGMIKEPVDMPPLTAQPAQGTPGSPAAQPPVTASGGMTIVRKADPANTVAYELPSVGSQIWRQTMAARAQANAQAQGQLSQSEAQGRTTGTEQAQQDFRNRFGMSLTPDLEDQYGVPPGQKWLPSEVANLAMRYNLVRGAETRNQGAEDRTQMRIDAQKQLQDIKDQFQDEQNQRKLDYQSSWNKARTAIAGNTQNSLNARAQMNLLDRSQREHGQLLDNVYKETQKQLGAQALLDPNMTPDGTEVADPFSGRKFTMNMAQRFRLKNAIGQSQQQVGSWQQRAADIEQQFKLPAPGAAPGTGNAAPAGGVAPAGRAPVSPPAAAASPAAPPRPQSAAPRRQVGDVVTLKNGKRVTVTKVNPDGSYEGQ